MPDDSFPVDYDVLLVKAEQFVKGELDGEVTGHDYFHSVRVANLAANIAQQEGADVRVARLAGLLHDVEDTKFSNDPEAGPRAVREFLEAQGAGPVASRVSDIVRAVSFKGANVAESDTDLTGLCVRDADRLEALGAIGIARVFAYGGSVGRPIHDPRVPVVLASDAGQYRDNLGTSMNHFEEKLFLLEDRMSTGTGRQLARERTLLMRDFCEKFLAEWEGGVTPMLKSQTLKPTGRVRRVSR